MGTVELHTGPGLAYREALADPEKGDPVVLLHGFPESSLMWVSLMAALAEAGRSSLAPDLYGLGDSTAEGPVGFERTLNDFTAFMEERSAGPVALVVHDWGGFIGLAWACDHPERVSALVISNTGFFSDGRWHGPAEAIRGEHGEAIVAAIERDGFVAAIDPGGDVFGMEEITAYWKPFSEGRGQAATLGFYRSMDMEKLAPWEGKLAGLGVPTLLLWGAEDEFAPISGAHRFQREIPAAELVALEGIGHFVFDGARERSIAEVLRFLGA